MKNKNIIVVRDLIGLLDLESLRNYEIVANLVRAFGIVQWGPPAFGDDEIFKNTSDGAAGIYQTPNQIAKALVYLSDFEINSYCEIGVFQGGNFLFVTEYLKRFNPDIRCVGVDPTHYLNDEIKEIIQDEWNITFRPITSDKIIGKEFDLVFIDGEHTGEWVRKDYENVGQYAKICMFHDIQETGCPDVVKFWEKIKGKDYIEFLDCTTELPSQGIGIIKRKEKA